MALDFTLLDIFDVVENRGGSWRGLEFRRRASVCAAEDVAESSPKALISCPLSAP